MNQAKYQLKKYSLSILHSQRMLLLILFYSVSMCFYAQKTRLIILADMDNEADEMQQMVHMTMCNNEFELVGLIAVTGKFLRPGLTDAHRHVTHPELFHQSFMDVIGP